MNENRGLWRGQREDNGEWVNGYYVRLNGEAHCIYTGYADKDCGDYYPDYYTVDPETLGECTGLTDKNGVLIFEGDIIKTKKYGKVVEHSNVNDYDIFVVKYESAVFRLKNHNREFNLVDDGYSKFEIIGNVHDNPELIQKGAAE